MLTAIMSNSTAFRNMVRGLVDAPQSLDVLCEMGLSEVSTSTAERLSPDLLIIDACPSPSQVSNLAGRILASLSSTVVVAVVKNDRDATSASLRKSGVRTVALNASLKEGLLAAISAAGAGCQDDQLPVARPSPQALPNNRPEPDKPAIPRSITPRETEILRLVAEGKKNSEIALHFGISDQTVKAHLANIYFRMGVRGRTEAALLGTRNGWLTGSEVPPEQPLAANGFTLGPSVPATANKSSSYRPPHRLNIFGLQSEEIALMFGRMLDDVGEGCWLIKDGRVAYANARIANLFGYTQDELVGLPFDQVLPQRLRAPIRQLHQMRLLGRGVPTRYSVTAQKRNGALFVARVSVSAVWHKGKRLAVAAVSDVKGKCPGEDDILHWLEGPASLSLSR